MDNINGFIENYNYEYLKDFYIHHVQLKCTTGLDRISRKAFENKLPIYLEDISRKVLNGTYKFTPYKEKLVLKGKDKNPRVISIPSIRDKVTLGVLKEIIFSCFQTELSYKIAQVLINEIKDAINTGAYDYFIKIDITNFFGSLNHDLLMTKIEEKITQKQIISLIRKAIVTPTLANSFKERAINKIGVPQGIPISNLLSNIYFKELDKQFLNSKQYKYFRYVDDIFVMCKEADGLKIKSELCEEIKKTYLLQTNECKNCSGKISDGFTYIGYYIKGNMFSVRADSISKLELGLESIFLELKYSNYKKTEFFAWELNLRITGCINNNNKYGWLFYFSQITDIKLLYHLDWLVKKLFERFNILDLYNEYKIKRFVRTYNEIINNLHETKYIPDFDDFLTEDKIKFLKNIIGVNTDSLSDIDMIIEFNKIIGHSIKDLEKDMQDFS